MLSLSTVVLQRLTIIFFSCKGYLRAGLTLSTSCYPKSLMPAMDSTFFKECSLNERIRLILRTGIFLSIIEYKNFNLHLFSISDFFVEVKVSCPQSDVESVRVISGEDVEKFVANVELPVSIWFYLWSQQTCPCSPLFYPKINSSRFDPTMKVWTTTCIQLTYACWTTCKEPESKWVQSSILLKKDMKVQGYFDKVLTYTVRKQKLNIRLFWNSFPVFWIPPLLFRYVLKQQHVCDSGRSPKVKSDFRFKIPRILPCSRIRLKTFVSMRFLISNGYSGLTR